MPEKNQRWIKIADHICEMEFGTNNIALTEAGDKAICVGRFKDAFFAFASKCPHAGGLLSNGCINEAGHIVCPVHGYKFNMRTGYNVSGEGYFLKHWPLAIRADGVFVDMGKQGC
ncbi:Rieske (2Fe-2S) protein [Agriterribacter sp.]|uniref:Rieske (2Fe-2S) protein n=1 Tax=Agriterribacter sp. TaxID=2821509 RepID=UPI002B8D8BE8|nr:Rieske 2Fe-2S domain-containing protein [Agriterribacter sp.]HTN08094.1 Rieske 2Fe-2S domain-containing protein [Agriterribacter sp.]